MSPRKEVCAVLLDLLSARFYLALLHHALTPLGGCWPWPRSFASRARPPWAADGIVHGYPSRGISAN